ncbi:MAG: SDR family NAD(P)-dependent oxidoreductase [Dehalococcoidia bacterium]
MGLELFDLTDRVAVVTGAGRGIGKSIALSLAEAGAHVVVASRTASQVEETAEEIGKLGRKSLAIPTDMQYAEPVENLIARTKKEFGRIDIMVNNAGGNFYRPFAEMTERAWDALIREDLKSVFLGTSAAGKIMLEQRRGSIINVASAAGFIPFPGMVHYATAKAAVIHFTRSLAHEWAPYNIRVNGIAPGFIETPGVTDFLNALQDKGPGMAQEFMSNIAMGRIGRPDEIKGLAIFLASDASSYITGVTVEITGGITKFLSGLMEGES